MTCLFFRTNFHYFELNFPNSLIRTINTVDSPKLSILPIYGYIKFSKLPCILAPFWSNVTYSSLSLVNVLIESRVIHQNGTVPSKRIYKMHEIIFIHVTLTHCRLQMASYNTVRAFQILSFFCAFEDIT